MTAVHVAAYLRQADGEGSTLLVDGDPNGSATDWGATGRLPFPVVSEVQAAKYARDHEHIVLDTRGRPEPKYLAALADGCDLLVLPSPPDPVNLRVLIKTVGELVNLGRTDGYKALLTLVPPPPDRDVESARYALGRLGVPTFEAQVRRRKVFQKAGRDGVPVYEIREPAARKAWEEYELVGREVVAEVEQLARVGRG